MKRIAQLLTLLMAALYCSSAFAAVDPYEVLTCTPAEGVVTSLQHFAITFADLPVTVNEEAIPTLQKGGGATYEGHMKADEAGTTVLVDFDVTCTASGDYYLNLPEGSLTVNGQRLLPLTLRFTIEGDIDSFYSQITINPAEGEVESMQYFTISFPEYVGEIDYGKRATLTNTTTDKTYNGEMISSGYTAIVYFNDEITDAGDYTLTIPAGAVVFYGLDEDVHELNFNYSIAGSASSFYDEITINPAEGRVESLQNFTITFPEYVSEIAPGSKATLTNNTTGTTCEAEMNDVGYNVLVNFAEEMTEAGRYTLTIPAGAIVINALDEEVHELQFNYSILTEEMPDFTINPPEGEVYKLQYFTIDYGQNVLVDEDIHPTLSNDDTGQTISCNWLVLGGNAVAYMVYPLTTLGSYTLNIPAGCIVIESTMQTNPEMEFHYDIIEKETFVPTVIEDQPEGELRLYHRSGGVVREVEKEYTVEEGENPYEIIFEQQNGSLSIVFADSNKVYIQRPVSWSYYNGWVEGTLSEDGKTITVPMGQYIAYAKSLEMAVQVGVFVYDSFEETYLYDESIDEMIYTINDDGSISLEGTNEYVILGTMNRAFGDVFQYLDYEWLQAGDYESVYYPATEQPVAPPDGLVTEEYHLTTAVNDGMGWDGYHCIVTMGFDGNDAWLKGICEYLPGAWIKGTRDGNTVTFPNSQLLGSYEVLLYFKCAEVDPTNGNTTQKDMVLTFDGEDTFTTFDYVFITADKDDLFYLNYYQGLTISKHPDTLVQVPEDLETKEYDYDFTSTFDGISTVEEHTSVNIGFVGDEVYIQGLWAYMPEAWVKGRLIDGQLVIDVPQYLGTYEDETNTVYPIFFDCFERNTGTMCGQLTFNYDPTTGIFSNPSNAYGVGINKTGYLNVQDFYDGTLTPVFGALNEIQAGATGTVEHYDLQGRRITDLTNARGIIITRNADGSVTKTYRK